MKGQIRNIYPGGNTPEGFYSYYNYILPQREAKKIFCIKGGPGVGKSTMMKRVGEHFVEAGENVDFLWCSSDPESLDGVLLKDRGIALVDGTSPHIVDPINPGAVDVILNLGDFWQDEGLRQNRDEILACNENIAKRFALVYGYLATAGKQYEFMEKILEELIPASQRYDARRILQMKLGNIGAIRRAESKMNRASAMGSEPSPGKAARFFAGAMTPGGLKNGLMSLTAGLDRVILIHVPIGFPVQTLLRPAAERIMDAGLDIEEYYCPMGPNSRLEHIVVPEGKLAIISCNDYHRLLPEMLDQKVAEVEILFDENQETLYGEVWRELVRNSGEQIGRALEMMTEAKKYHDELESFYIPHMDFAGIETATENIIEEIERHTRINR